MILRASVSRHGNFNELPSKDQNQKAGECFVISYKLNGWNVKSRGHFSSNLSNFGSARGSSN